jgi:hypothetical protein
MRCSVVLPIANLSGLAINLKLGKTPSNQRGVIPRLQAQGSIILGNRFGELTQVLPQSTKQYVSRSSISNDKMG